MSVNEQESAHPPASRLDGIAAGDDAGAIGAHLAACEACAAYVAKLRGEAAAFRGKNDAGAFAEKIARRAAVATPRPRAKVIWMMGPVLAAAAAVLLWLRTPEVRVVPGTTPPGNVSGDVARFKGGPSVVVVRERAGRQERLTGPFEVEASDRIRVEVAVDHDEPVVAGLLSADGTWTPLLAPTMLSAGTHYSELAARFDDSRTDALLLVGSPEDITRARATRNVDGVVAWRVRSAP